MSEVCEIAVVRMVENDGRVASLKNYVSINTEAVVINFSLYSSDVHESHSRLILKDIPLLRAFKFTFEVAGRNQVFNEFDIFWIASENFFTCFGLRPTSHLNHLADSQCILTVDLIASAVLVDTSVRALLSW